MQLKGKRIFIVEDNSQNRVVYQMMMIKARAYVTFNRWGHETIKTMKQLPKFDLIVLDLMLPGGRSGFDIFLEIRNTEEFADIPIVAISAAEPAIVIPRAQELGFDGFIAKPLDDELFVGQLASIIDGEKVWDTGSGSST